MSKNFKIGVFGVWRGLAFIRNMKLFDNAYVYAICDKNENKIKEALKDCPEDVKVFSDFDEFIESGMDAVILANYFHDHVPYAIKALEMGIPVLSETTAAETLKQCVDLCRAVERTGTLYFLAENYPFSRGCQELRRVYKEGTLGKVMFAEGEYVHPVSVEINKTIAPEGEKYHWRKFMPRTYYSTHSIAPLMYATDTMPKKVIGKAHFDPEYSSAYHRYFADTTGIMLCEMDDGSIFRISGGCAFGSEGNWYRLGCENGRIETVRGDQGSIRLVYNEWSKPAEVESRSNVYQAEWQGNAELAEKSGHGGGDFWVLYHFIECLLGNEEPYFDVYKGVAMSAVAILGWYSVLDDSKQYDIPDFRNEEERKKYENDDRTPFPREGKPATLRCSSKEWDPPYPVE